MNLFPMILFFILLGFWMVCTGISVEEFLIGCAVSGIVVSLSYKFFRIKRNFIIKLAWFLIYTLWYIYLEILSHIEVIGRIITGKLKPGIVEIKHNLSDTGQTVLATSITMTPGTLTLETGNKKLYIHCLGLKKEMKLEKKFKLLEKVWG